MSERGTTFSVDGRGGCIAATIAPLAVDYEAAVVVGRMPAPDETVIFERAPASRRATRVQIASAHLTELTQNLRGEFERHIQLDSLDPETKAEVVRIAADRARRIGQPLAPGETVSPEVSQARTTLAIASMTLMAVEAQELASADLTVTTLRDILRRQRPSLPN